MNKINIEVEAVNFKVSVIDAIEITIREKFPLDYKAQKEVFQYIKSNIHIKSYILFENIKNSEIMYEFWTLKSSFKKYLDEKLSGKIDSKDLKKIIPKILSNIYSTNIESIDEKILELTEKIERIKEGKFENKEEAAVLECDNSIEEKKEEIIDNYKNTLEQELNNVIENLRQVEHVPNTEPYTINLETIAQVNSNVGFSLINKVAQVHNLEIRGVFISASSISTEPNSINRIEREHNLEQLNFSVAESNSEGNILLTSDNVIQNNNSNINSEITSNILIIIDNLIIGIIGENNNLENSGT